MKELTHYFTQKDILFKTLNTVEPKALGSRKKIDIYSATGIDGNYYAIFIVDAKSRFLRKNADDLMLMTEQLASYEAHNFKKKVLLISSPLCSKAKKLLQEYGWNVWNDYK